MTSTHIVLMGFTYGESAGTAAIGGVAGLLRRGAAAAGAAAAAAGAGVGAACAWTLLPDPKNTETMNTSAQTQAYSENLSSEDRGEQLALRGILKLFDDLIHIVLVGYFGGGSD